MSSLSLGVQTVTQDLATSLNLSLVCQFSYTLNLTSPQLLQLPQSKTGFQSIALADLELAVRPRQVSEAQRSTCLPFSGFVIEGTSTTPGGVHV